MPGQQTVDEGLHMRCIVGVMDLAACRGLRDDSESCHDDVRSLLVRERDFRGESGGLEEVITVKELHEFAGRPRETRVARPVSTAVLAPCDYLDVIAVAP